MNSAGARRSMKSTESGLASKASTSALLRRLALYFQGWARNCWTRLTAAGSEAPPATWIGGANGESASSCAEAETKALANSTARRNRWAVMSGGFLWKEGQGTSPILLQQACQRRPPATDIAALSMASNVRCIPPTRPGALLLFQQRCLERSDAAPVTPPPLDRAACPGAG